MKTYKENTKYKLEGFQPVGVDYSISRTKICQFKNNNWYLYGGNKIIGNFIITKVTEIKENKY